MITIAAQPGPDREISIYLVQLLIIRYESTRIFSFNRNKPKAHVKIQATNQRELN